MPDTFRRRIECKMPQVNEDKHCRCNHDDKINPHLFKLQRIPQLSCQNQEIKSKIHTEQQHENRNNPLIIRADTDESVIPDCKTSGSGGTERRCQRFKQIHSSKEEENHLYHSQCKVNNIQIFRCLTHLRHKLSNRRSRAFRFHQIHMAATRHWHDRKQEYKNAHTTNPMAETSPEETSLRQPFHIRYDCCTCCRKSGNHLEQRICKMWNISVDDKRQASDYRHQNPRKCYRHETFPQIKPHVLRFPQNNC